MEEKINRILVLSPHTDDAELGAGGTIIKFIERGKHIYWMVFSTAEDSVPENMPKDTLKQEFSLVCKDLNIADKSVKVFDFPVRKLSKFRQEVLENLVIVRDKFSPDLVIGPSLNDFHQDHQVVANEMIRAFKSHCSIMCYELPWNHIEFKTQLFVSLEERHIVHKQKLLSFYSSQYLKERAYFSKEFIFGLATTRGIQVKSRYAEAFEVIRWKL